MGVQTELREAVENDRDDVIRAMAAYKVIPVENEAQRVETASLLGGGGGDAPDFALEQQLDGASKIQDRHTRKLVMEAIGVETAEDRDAAEKEIRDHPDWGSKA